ncbi:hypothetical protein EG327_000998 [Venturia inaequalis]|uniref:Uncharacterized protein n=1 Tax=Venturia inaequalis TaxID=5025 RepID=A0A8H3VMP5_VENIN|nr:hypothetical protein EG327_000998 [Venturia inaequalis]
MKDRLEHLLFDLEAVAFYLAKSCSSGGSGMASSSRFASESDIFLPKTTPEAKRRRRGAAADTKPRHSHAQAQQENGRGRKGHGRMSSKFEWPFPRREREGYTPPRKSQRHSIDRFFESIVGGREHPPPYQQSPRPYRQWRRRSFPKWSVKHRSERRDYNAKAVPEREQGLPSPGSAGSRDGIKRAWGRIRRAQEQVRKDRRSLDEDRAAHEAKVRYEMEQLGRDMEDEEEEEEGRRRYRQRRDGGDYYGFRPYSPPREEAMGHEGDYHDSYFGGYDYPPENACWGPPTPDYEDEDDKDSDDGQSFVGWESDSEAAFAQSAYRAYFQSPPRYNYDDFEESQQDWAEDAPSYREEAHGSEHKSEEIKKAYDAYIGQWKAISATASSIPYPTTDLTSALLLAQPEIKVDMPLSEDQTIEVNSALFFLLAFDLQPTTTLNSAGTPKLEIGPQADVERVKALQKQMKIERVRWHPDSLVKRRVDGMVEGVESKGVYRAVDELLGECKARLDGA